MLAETDSKTQKFSVRLRQRGQMTIPRQLRDALSIQEGDMLTFIQIGDGLFLTPRPLRTFELGNKIADIMDEKGVTLADLLQDLPKIREQSYQERYGSQS